MSARVAARDVPRRCGPRLGASFLLASTLCLAALAACGSEPSGAEADAGPLADASPPHPTSPPPGLEPIEIAPREEGEELSAGAATALVIDETGYEQPAATLDSATRTRFYAGQAIFQLAWADVAPTSDRAGLGPTFNATSCEACHLRNGRGVPPEAGKPLVSALLRISVPGEGEHHEVLGDPTYGDQIQPLGIAGAPGEGHVRVDYDEVRGAYDDGTPYTLLRPRATAAFSLGAPAAGLLTSLRVSPATHGMGFLEAIPEDAIVARADPEDRDRDGISGRPNRVYDPESGAMVLGRFGWKAGQPTVLRQNAAAFLGDIGVSSTVFPNENCPAPQTACAARAGSAVELSATRLEAVTIFSLASSVPTRRGVESVSVRRGKLLFSLAKCDACHVARYETRAREAFRDGLVIRPYTDLLLHDMGEGLADGRPESLADGREWRTAPLWGIGLLQKVSSHTRLLHDGRARGFAEAVLWHGGEADAARRAFVSLKASDRDALVSFLESL